MEAFAFSLTWISWIRTFTPGGKFKTRILGLKTFFPGNPWSGMLVCLKWKETAESVFQGLNIPLTNYIYNKFLEIHYAYNKLLVWSKLFYNYLYQGLCVVLQSICSWVLPTEMLLRAADLALDASPGMVNQRQLKVCFSLPPSPTEFITTLGQVSPGFVQLSLGKL